MPRRKQASRQASSYRVKSNFQSFFASISSHLVTGQWLNATFFAIFTQITTIIRAYPQVCNGNKSSRYRTDAKTREWFTKGSQSKAWCPIDPTPASVSCTQSDLALIFKKLIKDLLALILHVCDSENGSICPMASWMAMNPRFYA